MNSDLLKSFSGLQLSKACVNCGRCCEVVGIPTAFRQGEKGSEEAEEFYKARGYTTAYRFGYLNLYKEDPCPHLVVDDEGLKKCGVYESRPQACRQYSCLDDTKVLGETGWSRLVKDRFGGA